MVEAYPETKEECAAAIVTALKGYKENDESLNGSMISDLVQMNAALEPIALIEEVFKSGNVDEAVDGDFEDIQVKLGLIEKRASPRPQRPLWFDESDRVFVDNNMPKIKASDKKEKNKRKQEKKSRKRNRKK